MASELKNKSWYSRRHETPAAREEHRESYLMKQSMKKVSAVARQEERDARTDKEQLARLDKMFGKDLGAQKERARLNK